MELILQKIKKLRELRDITQQSMAFELNISQKAYCHLENGHTRMDVDRLIAIAQILNVSPSFLLADEQPTYTLQRRIRTFLVNDPVGHDKDLNELHQDINKLIDLLKSQKNPNRT